MANRQMARALGCSPSTIAHHLARLGRHCLLLQAGELQRFPINEDSTQTRPARDNFPATTKHLGRAGPIRVAAWESRGVFYFGGSVLT
jgi:hypothetical protein